MIPNEKEYTEEYKKKLREFYPPFIADKIIESNAHPEINDQKPTKITDFYRLYVAIWVIANKAYQEKYWVNPAMAEDNYMETMEEFLSTGEAVLDISDYAVEMTSKQREMLTKLYDMIDDFECDDDTPEDRGYGINDAEIIEHPKWQKIREYARLVYEELSGDDLGVWEKSRLGKKS